MELLSGLVISYAVLSYLCASSAGQLRPNRVRPSQNVSHQIIKTRPGQTSFTCSDSAEHQFTCGSGQCLHTSRLCNGIKDCKDGSDETVQVCKKIVCPKNTFRCSYGACIRAGKHCDRRQDCADNSDEMNCRYRASKRCKENQWQCKLSGKCILKTMKCNGRKDCDDGSDETIQECPMSKHTVTPSSPPGKQNTTGGVHTAGGSCRVPNGSDPTITFIDNENRTATIAVAFSVIEVFCNPNYALPNGQKIQRAVCSENGEWNPPLQSCLKNCPILKPVNADLSCFRGDSSIDCNADPIYGTRVESRCKPFHLTKTNVNYTELRCLANGEWDNELFDCSPDYCGIPSEEPSEPPSILHWTSANTTAYPWHVAIYNITRNDSLLCGGTLISPNMVVTAAVCFYLLRDRADYYGSFYDDDKKGFFHRSNNSITDYEIVISEYSYDSKTVDNASQKKYQVQQIIFPDNVGVRVPFLTFFSNNIAVLVLKKPIEQTKFTRPACVDWGADVRGLRQGGEGTSGRLAAWMSGLDVTNMTTSPLQHAEFPLTNAEQCSGKLIRISNIFCAGYDSKVRIPTESYSRGGGLVFDDAHIGRYTLRGIALESQKTAGDHSVTIFADISEHKEWLKKVRDRFSDHPLTTSNKPRDDFQSITGKTTAVTSSNSKSPALEITSKVTTISQNNATNISTSFDDGVCDIPDGPDVTIVLTDDSDTWLNISQIGSRAPKYSKIEVFCSVKYALPGGEKVQRSVCFPSEKTWNPPLKSCLKTCPPLYPENLYLSCYRGNLEVDCADEMVSGTRVRPRCKPLYHSEKEVYRELNCQENGEWDDELVDCIPDCGVTNSTVILKETELLIYNGKPANVSDTPWHVAIYRFSDSGALLICGGTLISANIVVSAAHCFFDAGRGVILNSTREYEIVVSKYTRDYATVDNGYQKIYKIREIIFTPLGYNPTLHGQHSNDIAVLVLRGSVEMNAFVLPACVDWTANTNGFYPPENTTGKLVGWGVDKTEGVGSSILLYAELPYISPRKCAGKLKALDPDKFCAGSSKGPGAEKGDSGGGLMFRNAIDGRYFLRGIVSTKDKESRNSIATFTDVSKYMDWLEKVRARVTTKASPTSGVCDISYSPDKLFDVFDENDNWLNIAPGSKAPQWSTIKVTCNPRYRLANGGSLQQSICFEEENWNPPLRPCLKICPPLQAPNMDVTCYREDSEIDCKKDLISGDRVQPRCKPLYRRETEAHYIELRCKENGEWDNELFECVPECGIINTETVEPTIRWTPANSSAYPWHVAVYKPSWNYALIWGGTLISPHMVITARRYYLPGSRGEASAMEITDTDFVVVVGKQTSNYTIRDSPYQKTYEVRYRLTPIEKAPVLVIAGNDIQILVLKKPVEMSKFVLPACIDWTPFALSSFQVEESIVGKLATWTLDETTDLRSPSLQQAEFPFISFSKCQPRLPYKFVIPNTFCTNGTYTSSSFTMGMNGEGLVVRDPKNGRYFLRGLAFTMLTKNRFVNLTSEITRFLDPCKHITWLRSVRDRVQAEVTPAGVDSVGVCTVPYGPDNRIVLTDTNDNRLNITTRLKAPRFAKVKITCNPKYLLSSGDRLQRSICVEKERWNPPLRPCLSLCPVLSSENVELLCYRDDLRVDCNGDLLQGTIIRPRCKPYFRRERTEAFSELKCLENGIWNNTLIDCVPDCGIPSTKLAQPPSTTQWTPINSSDVPWNVAIYDTAQNNSFLCGGTLISPHMIITAALCFYVESGSDTLTRRTVFDSEPSKVLYEIVVSKYSYDYDTVDNGFQKKYAVREIIFPESLSLNSDFIHVSSADIAVLVPKMPIEIGKFVRPVCFDWTANTISPDPAKNTSNELQLVAWPCRNDTQPNTWTLHYLQIPVIPCYEHFSLIQNIFCAPPSLESIHSTKPSMGNAITSYDPTAGRYILRGISLGANSKTAFPNLHVDVSKFTEWLTKVRDKVPGAAQNDSSIVDDHKSQNDTSSGGKLTVFSPNQIADRFCHCEILLTDGRNRTLNRDSKTISSIKPES